ncbi:BTAD domain-containing putative transcriptional regulator [Actinoplanes sp. N902-109]|uniref:AfsR/SARP family transcriptional regulator n=1 Tax=Actinoplanes sp. (strain N902-109) TaxID=649831 RepID=UPI0003295298|nr:BTAD domain-containing putative transcriptional regulator [Actinoplanes sp. N902-109]AGL17171.1 SARP family transcriptional regulator [Actinoplanes sp. N902-109]
MADDHLHDLRIHAFGELTVTVDDISVTAGPPKQRALLALLLCRADLEVPSDELIDALWGARPPSSARNNLRTYVHGLRRILGDEVISGSGRPGYRLHTGRIWVDTERFLALCATAEQALSRADPQAARQALADAVALRRGPAYGDTARPAPIADEAARLEELWLSALQQRAELDLQAGEAALVVGELTAPANRHPYRERLVALLMLALYRSGRQADALALYRRTTVALDQELGIEPGIELAGLHRSMLRQDPRLAPSAPAMTSVVPPDQLPMDLPAFVGRRAELERLDEAADRPLIIISGTAGVGKTTLAVHWATTVAGRFPDGVLHVNLRGYDPGGAAVGPGEAVRGFLEAFDVPAQNIPVTLTAQISLYRRLVAGKRVLVLLDNASDPEQVRPLVPNSPGCLAVVTSRHLLPALVVTDGAYPLPLDLLSVAESRQLLAARLGTEQVAAEPQPVDEIIDHCARLPLAMTLVTTRASVHHRFGLAALAGELRAAEGRLDALSSVDRSIDVRTVFSWSYDALTPDATTLFGLLGRHGGPDIAAPAAAALLGVPLRRASGLLAELTDAHLVVEQVKGRFSQHDLLRAYAAERLSGDTGAALRRVLDYYLHSAYAADGLLYPHRDEMDLGRPDAGVTPQTFGSVHAAAAWLTAERSALLAAVGQALTAGLLTHAFRLALSLVTFLDRRGYWDDEVAALHQGLAAARRMNDPRAEGHALRVLGTAHVRLGRYDEAAALAHAALTLFEAHADRIGQARTHRDLAMLHWRRRQHPEALRHINEVLDLTASAGLRSGPAFALYLFACVHFLRGDHIRAATVCSAAVAAYRQIEDRIGEAVAWEGCGLAYAGMGRPETALSCYEQALMLRRETGERLLVADSLVLIGDTHATTGGTDAARTAWEAAHEILCELGHPDAAQTKAKLNS